MKFKTKEQKKKKNISKMQLSKTQISFLMIGVFLLIFSYSLVYSQSATQSTETLSYLDLFNTDYYIYVSPETQIEMDLPYFELVLKLNTSIQELKERCSQFEPVKDQYLQQEFTSKESCINENKKEIFEKNGFKLIDLETQEQKAFYDFVDSYTICESNNDFSCACPDNSFILSDHIPSDQMNNQNIDSYYITMYNQDTRFYLNNISNDIIYQQHNLVYNQPENQEIKEINPCSINPLEDNEPLFYNLKEYDDLKLPLNQKEKIIIESKEINYSLYKTKNNQVCLISEPDEFTYVFYYMYYLQSFLIESSELEILDSKYSDVINILSNAKEKYKNLLTEYSQDLDINSFSQQGHFCDFLEASKFTKESIKEAFPECYLNQETDYPKIYIYDSNKNEYIFSSNQDSTEYDLLKNLDFNTFKENLLSLEKEECKTEKRYYNFYAVPKNIIFNYKTMKFENIVFAFSVYI